MSDIQIFLIYKIASMFAGVLSIYWGYKLFVKGFFSEAGELDARFGKTQLILKKAAPGTFFSLFGAIIISISVFKGLSMDTGNSIPLKDEVNPEDLFKPDSASKQIVHFSNSLSYPINTKVNPEHHVFSDSTINALVDKLGKEALAFYKKKNYVEELASYCEIKGLLNCTKHPKLNIKKLADLIDQSKKNINTQRLIISGPPQHQ